MKETKQPWPRSARVTVWALGIVIAASAIVNIIAVTQWYDPYQKWIGYNTVYLPIEEPKEEYIPIIMPDLEENPDCEIFEISDLHKLDFEYPSIPPTS